MARRKRPRGRKAQTAEQLRRCAEDHIRELETLMKTVSEPRQIVEISRTIAFWVQQIIASENRQEREAKYREMESKIRMLEAERGSDYLIPKSGQSCPG